MRYLPLVVFLLFGSLANKASAQIPNSKTMSVKVYGNCGMCKKTIEKAANEKDKIVATWDTNTKMLLVVFDSTKTDLDKILKRVASAGYDSEKFRAPDKIYNKLHGCCQYDRPEKL